MKSGWAKAWPILAICVLPFALVQVLIALERQGPEQERWETQSQADALNRNRKAQEAGTGADQSVAISPLASDRAVPASAADEEAQEGDAGAKREARELARRDLAAQESMAESTRSIVAATWIMAGLTAIGVVMLWRTLAYTREAAVATRDTVAATREIGQAQVRAYISVDRFEASPVARHKTRVEQIRITIWLKNTGQSPAFLEQQASQILLLPNEADLYPRFVFPKEDSINGTAVGAGTDINLDYLFLGDHDSNGVATGAVRCFLLGYVRFKDIFSKPGESREERFCVELKIATPLWVANDEIIRIGNLPNGFYDTRSWSRFEIGPES